MKKIIYFTFIALIACTSEEPIQKGNYSIVKKADNISGKDVLNNKKFALLDNKSRFTILSFVDIDCSHCIRETPLIEKIFHQYKNAADMDLIVVNISPGENDRFKEYVKSNKFKGRYITISEENKASMLSNYSFGSVPSVFLLDNEKNIIEKRVKDAERLKELIYRIR